MRRNVTWLVLASVAMMIASLQYARRASATPLNAGFTSTTLAIGRFGEIEVIPPNLKPQEHNPDGWLSWQKTKGSSDLYVQSNVWQPGGSTGWHTHPGHSLIIVTAGTVTGYDGNDPACKPHVYSSGMGFVDPGGDHVHILRNETGVVAKTIAVQLIPAATAVRIDAADPGNCHF
jgi:hypothetical protein